MFGGSGVGDVSIRNAHTACAKARGDHGVHDKGSPLSAIISKVVLPTKIRHTVPTIEAPWSSKMQSSHR